MESPHLVTEIIKLMLAPGLMISACGTLLLGVNGKYAMAAGRLRLLTEERRLLLLRKKAGEATEKEISRINNITKQLTRLAYRIKLLRNVVISYTTAIAFFIISSMLIGLNYSIKINSIDNIILFIFLSGVITTMFGMITATLEVLKAYAVVKYELSADS